MLLYHLGLFIHLVLIVAVSDIFFLNYAGKNEWKCEKREAISKRVVFIVADGLDKSQLNNLFLESNIKKTISYDKISYGLIEKPVFYSRYDGDLALVSGYSATPFVSYTTRFFHEPLVIDNFMNRSNFVFFIGDVQVYEYIYKKSNSNWAVNLFPKNGITSYENYTFLSNYAASKLNAFFSSSYTNKSIEHKLGNDKIIFYVNLGFISDSEKLFGHQSNKISAASKAVFTSIDQIINSVNDYYKNDKYTTFVICSNYDDDGIKEQPFIAWGAGISTMFNSYINQSDISVLISTLLGLQFPTSSKGVIPMSLLKIDESSLSKAMICNAMQLYNLAEEIQSSFPVKLSNFSFTKQKLYKRMQSLMSNRDYINLRLFTEAVKDLSLKEIKFYEFIIKNIIWYCAFIILLTWILLLFSVILPFKVSIDEKALLSLSVLKFKVTSKLNAFNNVLKTAMTAKFSSKTFSQDKYIEETSVDKTSESKIDEKIKIDYEGPSASVAIINRPSKEDNVKENKSLIKWKWLRGITDIFFFLLILTLFFVLYFYDMQPFLLIYSSTPLLLLWLFSYTIVDWIVFTKDYLRILWKSLILYGIIYSFGSWLMIEGLDQHNGLCLEFGMLIILQSILYMKKPSYLIIIWLLSGCFIITTSKWGLWNSSFSNLWALTISSIVLITWSTYATFRIAPKGADFVVSIIIICGQFISFGISLIVSSNYTPHINIYCLNIVSWLLISLVFLPAIHSEDISALVLNICMAIGVPILLFSTAFEPIFYVLISNFMLSWLLLEGYSKEWTCIRLIEREDARRALLYLFFVFFTNYSLNYGFAFNSQLIFVKVIMNSMNETHVWLFLLLKPFFIFTMMTAIFLLICSSNGVEISKAFNLVLLILQVIITKRFFQIQFSESGILKKSSLKAAHDFFNINVFAMMLMFTMLFCRYIYRLPVPKTVNF